MSSYRLIHGDCLDVLKILEPGSIDAVVTDPPYSDATHEGARTGEGTTRLVDFKSISFETVSDILIECARVCRRWIIATMDWRHVAKLAEAPPIGLRFVRFGVWVKPNSCPQFTGDRPGPGWEAIAFLHRANKPLRWNGGGKSSVFIYPKVNGEHPTQKPLRLARELVRLFADGSVLDPFMGSGTTGVACAEEGFSFIGIEKDERYFKIAEERVKAAYAQGRLFA